MVGMGDPYRSPPAPLACPGCNAELREYEGKLCCDACGGIMMDMASLIAAIAEIVEAQTGTPTQLKFVDEKAGNRVCPRCKAPLTTAHVVVDLAKKHPKMRPTLDHCASHGVWFDAGELTDVFEALQHAAAFPGHATLLQIIATLYETWGHPYTNKRNWHPWIDKI